MRPNPVELAFQQYHTDNEAVAKLFKFCRHPYLNSVTNDEDDEIQPYPIMHQLFHGRLLFVNCDFGDAWCQLI